ncbi:MAG: response regulator [Candidatus Krumholzibacteriia bacterium]
MSDQRDGQARVLIVDDEKMVLSSLASFLSLETDHDVRTFTDPREALRFAQQETVDVAVSDYLMPEMDGIALLGHLRELQPHAPRILLTGYADKENAIKGINEVGLFQYIEKPWDNDNLLLVLRNALEKRFLFKALQEKIAQIEAAEGQLAGLQKDILRTFI